MNLCDHYNYVKTTVLSGKLKKRVCNHVLAILMTYMETGLKVRFQNLWTKFWDGYCLSTMYQIFLIQIAFQSPDIVEFDLWDSVIKIAFNFKSRGTEKIELSSQGIYNFQILGHETLIVTDYKYAKISSLLCWIFSKYLSRSNRIWTNI